MPSQSRRTNQHCLTHPDPEKTASDLESEMIQLAQAGGLLNRPIDSIDLQDLALEAEVLQATLAELEETLADAPEELIAELEAELRMTNEALMVTDITRIAIEQLATAQ